jgi:L-malate glycosyltransferase
VRPEDDGPPGAHLVSWPKGTPTVDGPEEVPELLPAFRSILAKVRPDVVHAGPIQSCGYLAALSQFHPLLVMSWGSDLLLDAKRNEVWHRSTTLTLKRSDLLLCDSAAVRAEARVLVGYDDARIVQFPWGVDLNEFGPGPDRSGLRLRPGWDDPCVVLSTRSWEPLYGIETLLDAFQRAHAKESRLRLILLGTGSLTSTVGRFLKSNKLDVLVYRPGVVPHDAISDYYRAADLYFSCSMSDGSSVSLLEAMATGLPVVVSDTAGNREWVEAEKNGWLAPVADAKAFADRLIAACRSGPAERLQISRLNRSVTEERADWSKNSRLLGTAYEQLTGG